MEREGVEFITGVQIGTKLTWDQLKKENDAVLIATGARRARDLPVPGRELEGVHMAMDYLTEQNKAVAGDMGQVSILAKDKKVIVLGGGDTGSDCLGTALRQGAQIVHQIELLPRPPNGRTATNPWPQWPMIYRTSTSQEEGGERDFAVLTKRLSGKNGKVTTLEAVRINMNEKPGGGFQMEEIPGSELHIPVDLVVLALGFTGPDTEELKAQLGVDLDPRGNVQVNSNFSTNVKGVYAAGDAHRGASLIVWAIAEGREAARAIDSQLRAGEPSWLPTRGRHIHFGGR
jgi:glutamate synthase (NADPH/NADH) small chain